MKYAWIFPSQELNLWPSVPEERVLCILSSNSLTMVSFLPGSMKHLYLFSLLSFFLSQWGVSSDFKESVDCFWFFFPWWVLCLYVFRLSPELPNVSFALWNTVRSLCTKAKAVVAIAITNVMKLWPKSWLRKIVPFLYHCSYCFLGLCYCYAGFIT